MKTMWLFRSNLRAFEYYHEYHDLETFEKKCHDFYLLMCLWYLKNDYLDKVIIWRLSNKDITPIVFKIGDKRFEQRWVKDFNQVVKNPSPDISFFRGGFQEYDVVTKQFPKHFGKKIYLGAGKRRVPQWGGIYDLILMEDERDFVKGKKCAPFYKTASPEIFHPMMQPLNYDICWPCNFKQITQKGQEDFIRAISQSKELKKLKIAHCGNMPNKGKQLCEKYGVKNIEFGGELTRPKLNAILNQSKAGIVMSNHVDGCPRVLTEIIMSGTPLLVRNITHFLKEYKNPELGVIEFNDKNIVSKIMEGVNNRIKYKGRILKAIENECSFEKTCQKNFELWTLDDR